METKHLSTGADSSTDTKQILIVLQNFPKKTLLRAANLHPLRAKVFKYQTTSFHYFSPKDSQQSKRLDIGLWEVGGKRRLNRVNKKKSVIFFLCCIDFTPFMSKSLHIWHHFFPLLFPKDSEILKSLDIGLRVVGNKRPLNGVRNNDAKKILLSKAKFARKQTYLCAAILHPLLAKL